MMNDAIIEAREAAARELAKLFPTPETLNHISSVRSEYAIRQQGNDAQLSTQVNSQMEQAKAGIEALGASQSTIVQLRQNFVIIEKLCKECELLIQNHDQIKLLSNARNNLNKTLKDAEGMLSISSDAAEARTSLSNPRELVKTYEKLTALEGKRRFALAAAASRPEEAGKLREYFEDVNKTKETFEQTLWGYVRDFFSLAKESPQTLVRALRVVEMQEVLDEQIAEEAAEDRAGGGGGGDYGGSSASDKKKLAYKDKCYQVIQDAVDDRFADLLNRLVYEDLKSTLDEATAIANDLPDVFDYVAPCFPPRYEIFQLVVQLYTQHFVQMLQKFSDRAKDVNNLDILKLVGWLNTYEEQMVQLGVDEQVASVPAESGALDPLIDEYAIRMSSTMRQWLTNILEMDKEKPPHPREDGRLYTPVAVDVFRLLGEQVEIVLNNSNSLMLYKVALSIIQVLIDFQEQERERLHEPLNDVGLEALCAMVNNNVKCHDLAVELANNIVENLDPKHAEELDFSDACSGFLEVAKEAAQQTVEFIFADNGVCDLIAKLYQKDWYEGLVTEYLVATFADYFSDVKAYIEDRSFRRFSESCLERSMVTYIDSLLTQRLSIKEETIERMRVDEEVLVEFFREHISMPKLEERIQPLIDIRELAAADGVEPLLLGYTQLLKSQPDCPPEVVEKLVHLREGIPKKEAREVVQECHEIFESSIAENGPPKPGYLFGRLTALRKPAR